MKTAPALTLLTVGCVLLLCGSGCNSITTVAGGIKCERQSEPVIKFDLECRESDPIKKPPQE